MVCFSICGLANEDELLAHRREVATATSRFINAALVVIDRLKPVLLFGWQSPCRTGLELFLNLLGGPTFSLLGLQTGNGGGPGFRGLDQSVDHREQLQGRQVAVLDHHFNDHS